MPHKRKFEQQLGLFVEELKSHVSTTDGQWTIKGFIDVFQNVYTISSDTKIVSKILEIHLFPKILEFAKKYGYKVVLAEHQNHYPDISFVDSVNEAIRFAVDFKTTYRTLDKPGFCNGFTLGSHGEYFINRTSTKNIRFPYGSYAGHFCLGIIYDRVENSSIDETRTHKINELKSISSVVKNFQFFAVEKWKIASDRSGSGNTANIGSISHIDDIIKGHGTFSKLGEGWFDEYWMNCNKISIPGKDGKIMKIIKIKDFVEYKRGDAGLIIERRKEKNVARKN